MGSRSTAPSSRAPSTAPTPSLPWSDGLRAVAMLIVVVWHAVLTAVSADSGAPWTWLLTPSGGAVHGAVLIFIVLSGYLLGRHWRPGDLKTETARYLARRCWRLLPTYWFVLTLTIAAMVALGLRDPGGTHWDVGLPFTWGNTALNYLLLTDLAGISPYNHPAWTVPVEFHLYFVAPLIVFVRRRAAALGIGSALTLSIAFSAPDFIAPFFALSFVCAFWTGLHRQQLTAIDLRRVIGVGLPGALAGFAVAALILIAGDLSQGGNRFLLLDAAVTPLLIGWLLLSDLGAPRDGRRWRSHRLLESRPLRWSGERSYSIYLVHAVVIEIVWRFVVHPLGFAGDSMSLAVLAAVSVSASLFVGHLLYAWIERPTARRATGRGSP